jgi:hypothetical protein
MVILFGKLDNVVDGDADKREDLRPQTWLHVMVLVR